MAPDRNGLEILDRQTCLRLLSTATLGRIGISVGAIPVVLPVNFRLIDDRIVFRTGIGTKLDAATANAVVAFEVDDFDSFSHTGWSVVATGTAQEVTGSRDLDALAAANIPRWVPSGNGRVVAIDTTHMSGRRINDRSAPDT